VNSDPDEKRPWRRDEKVAAGLFEELLTDVATRNAVLRCISESIRAAHAARPDHDRWGVTLDVDQRPMTLLLNVGMIEVLQLHARGVAFNIPRNATRGMGLAQYEDLPYAAKVTRVRCDHANLESAYAAHRLDHLATIRAASGTSFLNRRGAHSPSVLRYLETALGISLPDPPYASASATAAAPAAPSPRPKRDFSTVGEVRAFVESVLPDPAERFRSLTILAESMDRLERQVPGRWTAYCNPARPARVVVVRCNIVLTVGAEVWLSLDQSTLNDPVVLARIERSSGWRYDDGSEPDSYPAYMKLPSRNIYYRPSASHDEDWPALRDAHFAYLDYLARECRDWLPKPKHHPALLEYMSQELRRPVGYGVRWESDIPSSAPPPAEPGLAIGVPFVPDDEDARARVQREIVQRKGQEEFRGKLIERYGGRCVVTGCSVEAALDAAHIFPYRGESSNHLDNGLLLRADIHKLFDRGFLWVDADLRIRVARELAGSEYSALDGRRIEVNPETQSTLREKNSGRGATSKPE
jgi:hypothetical protein